MDMSPGRDCQALDERTSCLGARLDAIRLDHLHRIALECNHTTTHTACPEKIVELKIKIVYKYIAFLTSWN